jgi:endonuclease G
MTIVDTGRHRPDRARLIEVRRNPADAWRSETLDRKIQYARRHGAALPTVASERQVDRALERIFKEPDFLQSRWLADGAKRCDAVARLVTPVMMGTGFLASPWLLVTNNHVLPDPASAADTEVTFRDEEDARGRTTRAVRVRLDPDRCFLTSPDDELDYTAVAVEEVNAKAPGKVFGSIPMVGATGKILAGQPVNIVQHPGGRSREIAVRNNLLVGVDDARYLTYLTDTEPGSSGSPVLNDAWELVALHSRAEQRHDEQGRPVDVDGLLATDDTPESRRVWVANKGIRCSAIVADLTARRDSAAGGGDIGSDAGALIDELLRKGGN